MNEVEIVVKNEMKALCVELQARICTMTKAAIFEFIDENEEKYKRMIKSKIKGMIKTEYVKVRR